LEGWESGTGTCAESGAGPATNWEEEDAGSEGNEGAGGSEEEAEGGICRGSDRAGSAGVEEEPLRPFLSAESERESSGAEEERSGGATEEAAGGAAETVVGGSGVEDRSTSSMLLVMSDENSRLCSVGVSAGVDGRSGGGSGAG
jgi:hypothetical protein